MKDPCVFSFQISQEISKVVREVKALWLELEGTGIVIHQLEIE
jgi:hypothetical protein